MGFPPPPLGDGRGEAPGGGLGARKAVELAQLGGVWGGSPMCASWLVGSVSLLENAQKILIHGRLLGRGRLELFAGRNKIEAQEVFSQVNCTAAANGRPAVKPARPGRNQFDHAAAGQRDMQAGGLVVLPSLETLVCLVDQTQRIERRRYRHSSPRRQVGV